ncbi:vacuolar protein sorting-associated protein 37B-like [Watersipora subatra]|uniref:vacuolar protein sorting-associated protein 37B-like n=1 Tax=Watersipora subatra TaxID=2589382 RepID=UPI00355B3690
MQRENTLHRLSGRDRGNAVTFNEEAVLGVLNYMDKDDLQELQDNEEKLEELINDQDQVRNLSKDKEMLVASNKSLAEYNLKMEPVLRQGKEMLALQYEKAGQLKEEYDTSYSLLESKSSGQSLDTTHALLQTRAAQSEETSDNLSELFLTKQMECDAFLEKYMEERAKTHLLKIKSEKLGEMIKQNVNQATWGGPETPVSNTHTGYPQRQPNTAPYPIYNSMMPHMPPVSS